MWGPTVTMGVSLWGWLWEAEEYGAGPALGVGVGVAVVGLSGLAFPCCGSWKKRESGKMELALEMPVTECEKAGEKEIEEEEKELSEPLALTVSPARECSSPSEDTPADRNHESSKLHLLASFRHTRIRYYFPEMTRTATIA